MKSNRIVMAVIAVLALSCSAAQAQSSSKLSSLLNKAKSALTGESEVTTSSIAGTWTYSEPAIEFESDNLLAKAGGTVAESSVESQLETVYSKLKISSSTCSFTFDDDGNFSQKISGKTVSGTYTLSDSTIKLTFGKLVSTSATISISGSTMELLFDADKLLTVLKATSSLTSSNSTLSTLSSLAENYDGLKLGYKLTK